MDDLLASLTRQTLSAFEVLIIEDGSSIECEEVCRKYRDKLTLHYFRKDNTGPGQSRNYGAARAKGDYLVILDSDVIVPNDYIENVSSELERDYCDAFGGADRAHPAFSTTQKAISYAMTSFLTTGGIRGGGKKRMDKFYPRSFNMGIAKEVFSAVGGFSSMRYGEDIDLSIRLFKAGYKCRLFPSAWVWHKRRTNLLQFFKQVFHSGQARIALYKKYPESLKIVHTLPALFTLFSLLLVFLMIIFAFITPLCWLFISPLLLFALLIALDAGARNRSFGVALMSIPAAFVQLSGYGAGFLSALYRSNTLKNNDV